MRYIVRERPPSERTSRRYGHHHHVGEVLVSEGRLSKEQLRGALEIEKSERRRLGEILLSRELVSGEDLARAVAGATGFEYVSLSEDLIDPAAIPLLGEKVLRKHGALPLRIEEVDSTGERNSGGQCISRGAVGEGLTGAGV